MFGKSAGLMYRCRLQTIYRFRRSLASKVSSRHIPTVTLNNGAKCPVIGLGTWQSPPGEVGAAVKHAIKVGYRHIDCAMIYNNEKEIGAAIRDLILKDRCIRREDLFITTKLWNTFHETEQVVPACRMSLENFGLEYIDLYLIHWPVAVKMKKPLDFNLPYEGIEKFDYDYVDTWKGMEDCVERGLTKSIGLSNFNSKQIGRVVDAAKIKPVMLQIELHPNLNQKRLVKFCKERRIAVTAYSPFASPKRPYAKPDEPVLSLTDPKLQKVAKKHGKTVPQVILRYIIQLGAIPIPKSVNKRRIAENINVFDFKLSVEDMAVLDSFNCNGRVLSREPMFGMPNYPFDIEY